MNRKKLLFLCMVILGLFFSSTSSIFALEQNGAVGFNMKMAYMITTFISFVLLVGYCGLVKNRKLIFVLLFTAVFIVNIGYVFLASSTVVSEALLANRISYLGAVFLPLFMLLIIMDVVNTRFSPTVILVLILCSVVIFLIAASPGYSTLYYQDVDLVFINGGAKLVKVYGPLHKVYYYYLFFYYCIMLGLVFYSWFKKANRLSTLPWHLLVIILGNIVVWLLGQVFRFDFEFLSISYIVTEFYLFSIYNMLDDYQKAYSPNLTNADLALQDVHYVFLEETSIPDIKSIISVWPQVAQLTSREVEVFMKLIMNHKRKEIAEELCVSENTVKKHVSNIFSKLGVSSRNDIIKMIVKINQEL